MKYEIRVYNFEQRIKKETENLEGRDDVTPKNKKYILEFKNEAFAQGYSPARILKFIHVLTKVASQLGKDFDSVTREDILQLVRWLEEKGFSEWTKYTYKAVIKVFYKWLNGGGECPDEVRWIKGCRKNLRTKLPEELLTEDEARALVDSASHPRDKALLAVLADGGLRIGEVLSRRVKHASFDEYGAVLTVDGKTGMRRVRLIYSAPHLATWINLHPFRSEPEAPLWTEIRKTTGPLPKGMSYNNASTIIRKMALRAGIRKRVHSHLFRHSRATDLASHLTEAQMNQHFGWTQGSRMTATYVHMSGREVDGALLRLAGVKTEPGEEKRQTLNPRKCPRCSQINADTARFCEKCWLPLDAGTAMDYERELESRGQIMSLFLQDPEVQRLFKRKMAETFTHPPPCSYAGGNGKSSASSK